MEPEVRFTGVKETLLITLQAKAAESVMPDSLLHDRFAAAVLRLIDQDFGHLRVGHDMTVGIALRAHMLDRWTTAFIDRHPDAVVLHLGCGLDSRVLRVAPPRQVLWFDIDFPDVIALRRKLYPCPEGYATIAGSIVRKQWMDRLPTDKPAMIVAEGVLPYLKPDQVPRLLRRLVRHFPTGEIAFDAYSTVATRLLRYNPAIRATGAVLRWALDDAGELERQVPGLILAEDCCEWETEQLARLLPPTRLALQFLQFAFGHYRMGQLLRYRF
jgi:O-methyltransferase involved in polyketide biosynthesis